MVRTPVNKEMNCGHCGCRFVASESQAKKSKYRGHSSYCSAICRSAGISSNTKGRPKNRSNLRPVFTGPCQTCGKPYESKTNAFFCSLACYNKSEQFRLMLSNMALAQQNRIDFNCIHCGKNCSTKASRGRHRFCSKACYRLFLADRYDRWIASPQSIALPQGYDEFMAQNVLPCLVDGCDWSGHHLSAHADQVHGIKSRDLKRAAGFNYSTGLVSMPLHRRLVESNAGKGAPRLFEQGPTTDNNPDGYFSLERKEHRQKMRLLRAQ